MNEWAAIFATLDKISTTTVRLTVDQKSENEFSIHLDATGQIPRDVADSIHGVISEKGTYGEDKPW